MARWEPGARGRLEQAAMDLYVERGFENVTVAEIAARAGVTERTFYRHFTDKREVLFGGSALLQDVLAERVASAPPEAGPLEAVGHALVAVGEVMQGRREWSKRRQEVIAANQELRERELTKLAAMTATLSDALRARGVKAPAASLAAEAGMVAFKVAYGRWIERPTKRNLPRFIHEALDQLRQVAAP